MVENRALASPNGFATNLPLAIALRLPEHRCRLRDGWPAAELLYESSSRNNPGLKRFRHLDSRGVNVAVILIVVEDDEQVRMLAQSILQDAGHETRSAATLTEAHAILESDEKIDALFVDVTLPDHQEAGLEFV